MDKVGWFLYNRESEAARAREQRARVGGKDVAHAAVDKGARILGVEPPEGQPNPAGMALHYALGVVPGAAYALGRERFPIVGTGFGALYGLALFIVSDELLSPVIGVAPPPQEYPWQAHARGLVSHVVLGVATEAALRLLARLR